MYLWKSPVGLPCAMTSDEEAFGQAMLYIVAQGDSVGLYDGSSGSDCEQGGLVQNLTPHPSYARGGRLVGRILATYDFRQANWF